MLPVTRTAPLSAETSNWRALAAPSIKTSPVRTRMERVPEKPPVSSWLLSPARLPPGTEAVSREKLPPCPPIPAVPIRLPLAANAPPGERMEMLPAEPPPAWAETLRVAPL